jgi:iron uptake system component EfeO
VGGYHRIEKALWVDDTTEGLEVTIEELRNDVANLNDVAIKADFDPVDIAQGSVDLMAEVSSSKITGEEERYSDTDVWDFDANVEGAEAGFEALESALDQVDPELVDEIKEQFAQMHKLLDPYRKGDGFVLYDTLAEKQTRELSQQVDALAESLSKVPSEVG